jgi:hypothetical protein
MRTHLKRSLLILTVVLIGFPAGADTIAIAVRERSDAEDAPVLAGFVEQAAMERLFQAGHIVFDLDIDPEDEVFAYRAIDGAETGGAASVIMIELELDLSRGDLQMPGSLIVEYVDALSEETLASFTVTADSIPRYRELTSDLLAEQMGDRAAALALETLGGDAGW